MRAKNKTVCFTGHRSIQGDDASDLLSSLYSTVVTLIGEGFDTFICGGAVGFDTEAAECVMTLRERFPSIRLVLYLPCRDQTSRWNSTSSLSRYKKILGAADEVEYTHDFYVDGCMLERNRKMVTSSSVCVAYLKSMSGGTAYTVRYAARQGLRVINLAQDRQLKFMT